MRLALVELKIAVAYLVRAYKFVRCDKTEVSMVEVYYIFNTVLLIIYYSPFGHKRIDTNRFFSTIDRLKTS